MVSYSYHNHPLMGTLLPPVLISQSLERHTLPKAHNSYIQSKARLVGSTLAVITTAPHGLLFPGTAVSREHF